MMFVRRMQITLKQQQYYLDHDINPSEPGAPTFMRIFIENSGMMFIPLLVMVIASDLVSSEHTLGSIKLLLTRPVKRWRIISKQVYFTLVGHFHYHGDCWNAFLLTFRDRVWI